MSRSRRGAAHRSVEHLEVRRLLSATAELLKVIYPEQVSHLDPSEMAAVGDSVYFGSHFTGFGKELWKSDGTPEGTVLVKDIWPLEDPFPRSSSPKYFIDVGGTAFFTAEDGVHNRELWKSDGTPEGTVLVKDVFGGSGAPTTSPKEPRPLIAMGNTLLFAATNSVTEGNSFKRSLWRSDGTAAGTVLVKNIGLASPAWSDDWGKGVIEFNGSVYVVGNNHIHRTDGTTEGTIQITSVAGITTPDFVELGGELYFTRGRGLYKTNGEVGNDVLVFDFPSFMSDTAGPRHKTVVGDYIYSLTSHDDGYALWRTHGPTGATNWVAGLASPENLVALDGALLMAAANESGEELWRSDGTREGTVLLKDIMPGSAGSAPSDFTWFDGALYFSATSAAGRELWKTDGTALGTVLVQDLAAGSASSNPEQLVVMGDSLVFAAGGDLWTLDAGAAQATTVLVQAGDPEFDTRAGEFTQAGDDVFFVLRNDENGREVWRTDGTSAGTQLVEDIWPGEESSTPFHLTELGGKLIFGAMNEDAYHSPWTSDGTVAGTVKIKDVRMGGSYYFPVYFPGGGGYGGGWPPIYPGDPFLIDLYTPAPFGRLNGELFFSAGNNDNGDFELWKTDGSEAGTVLVKDINGAMSGTIGSYPGGFASYGGRFVESGGELFFAALTQETAVELWKTDGSEAGTVLVKDLTPGNTLTGPIESHYFGPQNLTDADGTLFFTLPIDGTNFALWKSDGTTAGTVPVVQISRGPQSPLGEFLVPFGGFVYFAAYDDTHGAELWRSDGTAGGTHLVTDLNPGSGSRPEQLTVSGGWLYFTADDGVNGRELWRSDGTAAGTMLVADIRPDGSSTPRRLTPIPGGLAFVADDNLHGEELWITNGTASGTEMVADLWEGALGSEPGQLAYLDSTLYFVANDGAFGRQVFVARDIEMAVVADAGGPYTGGEGEAIALSGARSGGTIDEFAWDLDNDGTYETLGRDVVFPQTADGQYVVGLRVSGPLGVSFDTATVTVENTLPSAAISAQNSAQYRGETVTYTLTASDPLDANPGPFTWDIDWDNDGTWDQSVSGLSGTTVAHAFATNGVMSIAVRATDDGGDTGPTSLMNVTVSTFVARFNGSTTDLWWGGTPGNDATYFLSSSTMVTIIRQFENGVLGVAINVVGGINGRIKAFGYGGDDIFDAGWVNSRVTELRGGEGNDNLYGGTRGDSLWGGGGHDLLVGGLKGTDLGDRIFGEGGNDVLFGYLGADTLNGGAGEDLLVGDTFDFSAFGESPYPTLTGTAALWATGDTYENRVAALLFDTLLPTETVVNDGAVDRLTGEADLDWLFYTFGQDLALDPEAGEEETDAEP